MSTTDTQYPALEGLARYSVFTCAACIAEAFRADSRFLRSFPVADMSEAKELERKWERDALVALIGAQPQSRKHYRSHSRKLSK